MSNAVSALNGAKSNGYVSVVERGLVGMVTVRGDFASKPFGAAIKKVTGQDVPDTRRMSHGRMTVAWMSPDELLIVCDHAAADQVVADLSAALAGQHHLVVNVSDARAVFGVTGERTREVIAKLAPVDMHPMAFGTGEIRRTRLAQVPAAFWLVSETEATVVCFRSVAEYVFKVLTVNAASGSEVGAF